MHLKSIYTETLVLTLCESVSQAGQPPLLIQPVPTTINRIICIRKWVTHRTLSNLWICSSSTQVANMLNKQFLVFLVISCGLWFYHLHHQDQDKYIHGFVDVLFVHCEMCSRWRMNNSMQLMGHCARSNHCHIVPICARHWHSKVNT